MKCPKCSGLVVKAKDERDADNTHCVNCGWRAAPKKPRDERPTGGSYGSSYDRRVRW